MYIQLSRTQCFENERNKIRMNLNILKQLNYLKIISGVGDRGRYSEIAM